ncbi:EF hand domain-containing protein [Cyclospora cayetanensis]|uniref:EF hand domain-containing protein n=1 Tax=Cyclospora cayetanensis TaxID=88456 RepID=A0A1D3D333_9EIME|nr:EF hand domain-containing protein [Cyclospora cayetanensis]
MLDTPATGAGRRVFRIDTSWPLMQDVLAYVRRQRFVSAACRLPLAEELELLRLCNTANQALPEITNRQTIVEALLQQQHGPPPSDAPSAARIQEEPLIGIPARSGSEEKESRLRLLFSLDGVQAVRTVCPSRPHIEDFDASDASAALTPLTCLSALTDACGGSMVYRRPDEELLRGAEGLEFVGKTLDRGVKISDFMLLYELLTDALPLRVAPGEAPRLWGALLLRCLPSWDLRNKGRLLSILRLLLANPHLTGSFPQLHEEKKSRLPLGLAFRSPEPLQHFFKDISQALLTLRETAQLRLPAVAPEGLLGSIPDSTAVSEHATIVRALRLSHWSIIPRYAS